ncbi:hypothetical protein, partial [Psychrobacter aquimaris]|uniref:hypothetical protein n=1 Tax=Psychrobacter aquimaris TaxID=292733 RepID=UPI003FD35FD5
MTNVTETQSLKYKFNIKTTQQTFIDGERIDDITIVGATSLIWAVNTVETNLRGFDDNGLCQR